MTKVEFIQKAADRCGVTQKEMTKAVEAIESTLIEDVFAAEDKVTLKIGTFQGFTKVSKERNARNPKTGEVIVVPGKTVKGFPKFKPSKSLKG